MIRELHIRVQIDEYGTYITELMEQPPPDRAPADVYDLFGYRVGVYPAEDLPRTAVRIVVHDVVHRLATNDGLE